MPGRGGRRVEGPVRTEREHAADLYTIQDNRFKANSWELLVFSKEAGNLGFYVKLLYF